MSMKGVPASTSISRFSTTRPSNQNSNDHGLRTCVFHKVLIMGMIHRLDVLTGNSWWHFCRRCPNHVASGTTIDHKSYFMMIIEHINVGRLSCLITHGNGCLIFIRLFWETSHIFILQDSSYLSYLHHVSSVRFGEVLVIIVLLISYDCARSFIIVMMCFVYRRCFSSFSLK